ncbi:MAG: hypothetical protein H6824_07680 [Planctomycetaceae bacterium]|nr:hypothetical protein [Planctomycetaceae bacterium]
MRHCFQPVVIPVVLFALSTAASSVGAQESEQWTAAKQIELVKELTGQIDECDAGLKRTPDNIPLLSQRGDCHFFLGHFDQAVADYSRMIELDAEQGPSHWRRGIALFYAGKHGAGAEQFERYHSFDNVDRENGIWRYFCQFKAVGKEQAQKELLRYEKDDREPFPAVYKLFSGELKSEDVMLGLQLAKRTTEQQASCEFYAHLYVGLNAALEGDDELALKHLTEATNNSWPREAGYGPRYMWHVGRLHADLLRKTAEAKSE